MNSSVSSLQHSRWTAQNEEELLFYWARGHTAELIAEVTGRTPGAIRARLKRLQAQEHPDYTQAHTQRLTTRKLAPADLQQLQTLVDQGLSSYRIARRLNLTPSCVWSRLKRYNIQPSQHVNFANFLSSSWRPA